MSLLAEVRARAEQVGALPRKKWGQNFLIEPAVLDAIADAAVADENMAVLEIGPGPGTLTERLSSRARRMVVVERDPRWVEYLRSRPWPGPLKVVEGDVTRLRLEELREDDDAWVLAGNIPYNLSAPILLAAWHGRSSFRALTVMLQAEVAERLLARPGSKTYGSLSVLFQRVSTVTRVRHVSAGCFARPSGQHRDPRELRYGARARSRSAARAGRAGFIRSAPQDPSKRAVRALRPRARRGPLSWIGRAVARTAGRDAVRVRVPTALDAVFASEHAQRTPSP
ncbi:MAG: hypothetical protein HC923_12800 [Myxococcales bacterium]|nr:hypothetical protein [Myxococcales bacterium]